MLKLSWPLWLMVRSDGVSVIQHSKFVNSVSENGDHGNGRDSDLTAPFFPEPKIFGSADGWPAEGRPAGGGAR